LGVESLEAWDKERCVGINVGVLLTHGDLMPRGRRDERDEMDDSGGQWNTVRNRLRRRLQIAPRSQRADSYRKARWGCSGGVRSGATAFTVQKVVQVMKLGGEDWSGGRGRSKCARLTGATNSPS
jgi:hypothetical protein